MGKMLDFIDERILKVQPKNESISFKFYIFSIITSHMFDMFWFSSSTDY